MLVMYECMTIGEISNYISGCAMDKQNINKIVSCDILKEKLQQLVKQSKNQRRIETKEKEIKPPTPKLENNLWNDLNTNQPHKVGVMESLCSNINNLDLTKASIYSPSDHNMATNIKLTGHSTEVPPLPDVVCGKPKATPTNNVRRSDTWQGNQKCSKSRQVYPQHVELRTAEIRQLDQQVVKKVAGDVASAKEQTEKEIPAFTPLKPVVDHLPEAEFKERYINGNTWHPRSKTVIRSDIDRNDPKRISRRYIPRRKVQMLPDTEPDAYEKVNVLPPTQFRDIPPPPEAFRDPPEPIDNILYYVMESVQENREVNRQLNEENGLSKEEILDFVMK